MSDSATNGSVPLESGSQPGSSKASNDVDEHNRKVSEVDKLYAEGQKLIMAEVFEHASEKFEEAAKIATEFFGEFAPETFLPAFEFGKTLVEIVRLESEPIAPPMESIYEEEEDEEESQEEEEVNGQQMNTDKPQQNGTAEEEGTKVGEENGTKDAQHDESKKEEKGVDADAAKEESTENQKLVTDENGGKEDGQTQGEEEEMEEEQQSVEGGDIQLAWEWLEIARKICEKQEQTHTWLERKADVQLALGTCKTVAEDFEQALQEYNTALEISQAIFPPTHRRISEVHFMIGLTYNNMNEFTKAAEQFEAAKQVLQGAIEVKEKELEGKENLNSGQTLEEVNELKQVVKTVEERIQDARESSLSRARQLAAAAAEELPQVKKLENAPPPSADEKVNDLTTAVKRKPMKRPLEEAAGTGGSKLETAVEKIKLKDGLAVVVPTEEEQHNGNGTANGHDQQVEKPAGQEPGQKRVKLGADESAAEEEVTKEEIQQKANE